MSYEHKSPPYPHQAKAFEETRETPCRALWWETGCGKTKPIIDTAAWLFEQRKISAMLVLAPASVVRNWTQVEIPRHLPDRVPRTAHAWTSSKARTKTHQQSVEAVLGAKGLAVLAMSYDGMMTELGAQAAWDLMRDRPTLYVLDEVQRIKTPGSQRTKRVLASARYAPYRRILTGTPVADTPFDVYGPVRFLFPNFWKQHGITSFAGFKATFGQLVPMDLGGRVVMKVVGYRNFDLLRRCLEQVGDRLTKEQVLPNLPPRVYTTRSFEMIGEQARVYRALEDDAVEQIDQGLLDEMPELAITLLLRLQQVACGFLPDPEGKGARQLVDPNPRLELLREVVDDALEASPDRGVIVWARFRYDLDAIAAALADLGVARIDGSVPEDQRPREVERFQAGDARVFVGNPSAGGTGLTLTRATTVVRYSRSFSLEQQLQSDDRAYRIGQDRAVNYVDLVADGTVDENIAATLADKHDVARIVTGDVLRSWLQKG